jgi:hypothetical protein
MNTQAAITNGPVMATEMRSASAIILIHSQTVNLPVLVGSMPHCTIDLETDFDHPSKVSPVLQNRVRDSTGMLSISKALAFHLAEHPNCGPVLFWSPAELRCVLVPAF